MVCAVITYCVYILYDTEINYDNLKFYVAQTPLIAYSIYVHRILFRSKSTVGIGK